MNVTLYYIQSCVLTLYLLSKLPFISRELQTRTNYYMLSLAISDLLVCLIIMPCSLLVLVKGEISNCLKCFNPALLRYLAICWSVVCHISNLWCARLFSLYSPSNVHLHCSLQRHQKTIPTPSRWWRLGTLSNTPDMASWSVPSLSYSSACCVGHAKCDAKWKVLPD